MAAGIALGCGAWQRSALPGDREMNGKGAKPMAGLGVVMALLVAAQSRAADGYAPYAPELAVGTRCVVDTRRLRPTRFAVGYKESALREASIGAKTAKDLDRYLRRKIAPIVIGPGGEPYLLDQHALSRLALQRGEPPVVYAEVRANWRDLAATAFWQRMKERGWVELLDETGRGPQPVADLPKSLRGMRDDPYRSLAWAVRQKGGYEGKRDADVDVRWAGFLRAQVPATAVQEDFDKAVEQAVKAAHSEAAKDLPGYLPPGEAAPAVEPAPEAAPPAPTTEPAPATPEPAVESAPAPAAAP
jgi:hypothetical protein